MQQLYPPLSFHMRVYFYANEDDNVLNPPGSLFFYSNCCLVAARKEQDANSILKPAAVQRKLIKKQIAAGK